MSDNFLKTNAGKVTAGVLLALAVSACEQGASSQAATSLDSAQNAAVDIQEQVNSAADTVAEAASVTPSTTPSAGVTEVAATNLPALSEFAAVWGPELASTAPAINAIDQNGASQSLASLAGERGLLLVFSRSADW